MARMGAANVLLLGLGGLGVEIGILLLFLPLLPLLLSLSWSVFIVEWMD